MIKKVSKEDFIKAEAQMEKTLAKATKQGGFEFLTEKDNLELETATLIVKKYEEENIMSPKCSP